jgi:hypothetical protein
MAIPFDACEMPQNPEELNSKIALVGRGHCNFTEKVLAMQQANARAVVVMDSDSRGIDSSSHFEGGQKNDVLVIVWYYDSALACHNGSEWRRRNEYFHSILFHVI